MPELPELTVLRENLESLIKGKALTEFSVLKPYIQKTTVPEDLVGQKTTAVTRRGKYITIDLERHRFIIHLMLAGRFKPLSSGKSPQKTAACLMRFGEDGKRESGIQLTEDAKLKRMSMWIVDIRTTVDQIKPLGLEPLSEEFSLDKLTGLMTSSRQRLKSFLVNQRNIAGIGNAYSDEICWEARLSPYKQASKLNPEEVSRLHTAVGKILSEAVMEVRRLTGNAITVNEERPTLAVHRRKGEACPRCGSGVQWVSATSRNTYYCPRCQTGGKILKDGRTSKFVK